MATKPAEKSKELRIERPEKVKLSAEETLRRMQTFEKERKEKLVAVVREGKS